jgi:hypothetical protein
VPVVFPHRVTSALHTQKLSKTHLLLHHQLMLVKLIIPDLCGRGRRKVKDGMVPAGNVTIEGYIELAERKSDKNKSIKIKMKHMKGAFS